MKFFRKMLPAEQVLEEPLRVALWRYIFVQEMLQMRATVQAWNDASRVVAVLRIVFHFLLRRELGGALVAEELARSLRSEPKPTSSGWMVTFERRSERWHNTVREIAQNSSLRRK